MSSLLSQVFDPAFIFNPVYHNVAKLINRRILTSHPMPLAMTQKVPESHFPVLRKLSQLFFETQKLTTPQYAILLNTSGANMKNYLIGFADGSLNFSTSSIYLLSYDTTSDRSRTSLINTMSKLVDNTKINQTEAFIPHKEMHGLWLAASNALKALQTTQNTKITIEAVYLGSDALSQVVGLSRPPQILKPKIRRLYANINLHLFELANLTGQKKEDIVFWIEDAANPADRLGKFDIDKDPIERWISLANQVLFLV